MNKQLNKTPPEKKIVQIEAECATKLRQQLTDLKETLGWYRLIQVNNKLDELEAERIN